MGNFTPSLIFPPIGLRAPGRLTWALPQISSFYSNIGDQRFVNTKKFTFEIDNLQKRCRKRDAKLMASLAEHVINVKYAIMHRNISIIKSYFLPIYCCSFHAAQYFFVINNIKINW